MRALFPLLLGIFFILSSCSDAFPRAGSMSRLEVEIKSPNIGTPDARRELIVGRSEPFDVTVRAYRPDGKLDTSFRGWVRLSVKPGTVERVEGPSVEGRNVRLEAGEADARVHLAGFFGDTTIWAEDIGYVPADPTREPPPRCADGRDNDRDGFADFPADSGCAFANDDSEEGGSFAAGTSLPMYFALPRIADVRGVSSGGGATAFPKQQVLIDTGYRITDRAPGFAFVHTVVVTRTAPDGFYVTDIDDSRGFGSIFAFTFNAPPGMKPCDRLKSLGGTSMDFFGFNELTYPTWTLEEYYPEVNGQPRPCLIPDARALEATDLADARVMKAYTASMVRVVTEGTSQARVSRHFGPGKPAPPPEGVACSEGYLPTDEASNCDLNSDGRVDFDTEPEKCCANQCTKDVECTEFTAFAARGNFRIVLTKTGGGAGDVVAAVGANATQAPRIDPVLLRNKTLRSFMGTMRFFSGGGGQYTIEARCADDIVLDMNEAPKRANEVCLFPRIESDPNAY